MLLDPDDASFFLLEKSSFFLIRGYEIYFAVKVFEKFVCEFVLLLGERMRVEVFEDCSKVCAAKCPSKANF